LQSIGISGSVCMSTYLSHKKLDLAAMFYFARRLSEARQLQEEVMKKRIEILGPDHISTLSSMTYLAVTLRAQGHVSDAVELVRKCCEVYEKIASPGSKEPLATQGDVREVQSRAGGDLSTERPGTFE
jgi:hypothetical protein